MDLIRGRRSFGRNWDSDTQQRKMMETKIDEAGLFTGLAVLHWSQISIFDKRVDQSFYQALIQKNKGKSLELGCGAGRLLLTFLKMDLDDEGGTSLPVNWRPVEEMAKQPGCRRSYTNRRCRSWTCLIGTERSISRAEAFNA
ncbi:MAG: hypothetical protein CME26_10575 [Gemmatimonadetes bacterium]|nr:hypothetical protein [Gemmatimonadota bacterium]